MSRFLVPLEAVKTMNANRTLSLFWLLFCIVCPHWASANPPSTEKRMALIVGNQTGWKGEPHLDYVLSGDVRPLAQKFRELGFEVKQLENANAQTIRQTLSQLTTLFNQDPAYKTFVFYYSGHADDTYFHLGRRTKQPLSYAEFASQFKALRPERKIAIFDSCYSGEIIRRFGSLSRYKKLLKKGKTKGIRARRKIDLHKLIIPKQGHEQGIRIIASSLDVSWELKQYKASVFTHHMLQGIKGPADTNHDGRITIDELFDYTSQRVLHETGQRPQQLLLLKRSAPYAIAPVYRSQLTVDSDVAGKIKVAVANFMWSKQKQKGRALKLAVVDGRGTVFLEHKGQCYQQKLKFPKGGEARLRKLWNSTPCKKIAMRRKGALQLAARLVPPPKRSPIALALTASFTQVPVRFLENANWGGGFQLRFFDTIGAGLYIQSGQAQNKSFSLTTVWLRPEIGWTFPILRSGFSLDLYTGAFAQIGLTTQHTETPKSDITNETIFVAGAGGVLDLSLWFNNHLGLRFGGLAGFNYTPVNNQPSLAFQWQLQSSILLGF